MSSDDRRPASSSLAVEAYDLGKSFLIDRRPSAPLAQAVLGRLRRRRPGGAKEVFWALRGVSLRVASGETVGIMGVNGSGKSTFLEILAGTLHPSEGGCRVTSPVAALLDLGTGFNAEFTGRENVELQAAVLGYGRRQVAERIADIAEFAEVGPFLDQPVKTYSNGMLLRLAFAVATAVEPAVLLVDEVLAVGDEAFQRRCFSRMEEMRRAGATILFASHDATSVLGLCDRVLLLDRGELLLVGEPKPVVETYHRLCFSVPGERETLRRRVLESGVGLEPASTAGGSQRSAAAGLDRELVAPSLPYAQRGAVIEDPEIRSLDGQRLNLLEQDGVYVYAYTVRFSVPCRRVRFGMLVKTKAGYELGGGTTIPGDGGVVDVDAGRVVRIRFRFRCALNPGVYFLNAGVLAEIDGEETYVHRILDAAAFRVIRGDRRGATGIVDFGVDGTVSVSGA